MISIFPIANTYLNIYQDRCEFSQDSDNAALMTVNINNSTVSVNHTHSELAPLEHSHSGYSLVNHSHTLASLGAAAEGHTHNISRLFCESVSYVGTGAEIVLSLPVPSSVVVGSLYAIVFYNVKNYARLLPVSSSFTVTIPVALSVVGVTHSVLYFFRIYGSMS